MARRKSKASDAIQTSFLENYGKTAPAVPAIRTAVKEWRESGYKGASETTKTLLNYWFHSDHKNRAGLPFSYYHAQQEAVESLVYVFEIAKTRSTIDLYERFIPAELAGSIRFDQNDPFARYATKMATGSGKTKVMSLVIAWQYFNAVIEGNADFATTFLIIAPNVIVFERLSTDFVGGKMYEQDPIIPREFKIFWDMQFYVRGESERASSTGAVYVTNIQQLYDTPEQDDDEPEIMTLMLGKKPPANLNGTEDFRERILKRGDSRIMVINDEAHHTHEEDSAWNNAIRSLAASHAQGMAAQVDFSATPRYGTGTLFAWTISDYTLKQAIIDRIVKRPVKGITDIQEAPSSIASVRYEPFLVAGIERWREYREALEPMEKTPLLFIMMNDTQEADSVGDYLRTKYPKEFGGDKTLIIHTKRNGDIRASDLDAARKAAREVDSDKSPVNAIVSVLMLREGWDVQNVTVIVGLRPYTSKAKILPEQTIGRGLRLMFRNLKTSYTERVDIIGNPGFINFVEELEKEEDLQLDTWQVGKEKLVIEMIQPVPEKADYDIALPMLSPIYARSNALAAEIQSINVHDIKLTPLPIKEDSTEAKTFRYEGRDILTLEKLVEREYKIPTMQTSGEIISYFAQIIAHELKLPSQFAVLAPKIREFLQLVAFGKPVDLDSPDIVKALSRRLALYVTRDIFLKILRDKLIQEQTPELVNDGRLLSGLDPFPWSRNAVECLKTVFNKVPCDNEFEADFAKFLDRAADVNKFAKLPSNFAFSIPYTDTLSNLRHYYPDFVVVDYDGVHYIVETKGREDVDVKNKDRAASLWVENVSGLTGVQWQYVKVLQSAFNSLQAIEFADYVHVGNMQLSMFDD